MKTAIKITAAALLVAFTAGLNANEAKAIDRLEIANIVNQTNGPVNFQVRFVGGTWTSYTLQAGANRYFYSWFSAPGRYDAQKMEIRYDADLQAFGSQVQVYQLNAYSSPDVDTGRARQYIFQSDGNSGRFIDLRHTN